jgi:hypothetical protein
MARHLDANGYINDLAVNVNEQWFTMICDLTTITGKSTLDQLDLDTLLALFRKRASYLGMKPITAATGQSTAAPTTDFLEALSGFSNFKLLECTLQMAFTKRITVVFGANGSGKSSLCESLKVLANAEPPIRPLQNLRASGTADPEFSYKFKSNPTVQLWTPTVGYGPKNSILKYFDAGIALRNVKIAVEPGRVVMLVPFKLHVFEWARVLTTKFREVLQQASQTNIWRLSQELAAVREEFGKYAGHALATIDEKMLKGLGTQIKTGEAFSQHDLLKEKQTAVAELEKATSVEGLKLLKAEHRDLDVFLSSLATLLDSAEELWKLARSCSQGECPRSETGSAGTASESTDPRERDPGEFALTPPCSFGIVQFRVRSGSDMSTLQT